MSNDPPADKDSTFLDKLRTRAAKAAQQLLEEIPELEGIAVVPSYSILDQNGLPHGFIFGKYGPLQSPTEIMHMSIQLHYCQQVMLNNGLEVIQEFSRVLAEQVEQAQRMEKHLQVLEKTIHEHPQQQTGPASGDDAGSRAASEHS